MPFLSYIAQAIAVLLALFVLLGLLIIIQVFAPKRSVDKKVKHQEEDRWEPVQVEPPKVGVPPPVKHKKYKDPIELFEIEYWQGVEEPWRWNSYAEDLIKYATENLPLRYVELHSYNVSRQDPGYERNKERIERLRLKKLRRFPLVCINYDKEYHVINSSYAYDAMIKRIDDEWERYYGLV